MNANEECMAAAINAQVKAGGMQAQVAASVARTYRQLLRINAKTQTPHMGLEQTNFYVACGLRADGETH